MRKMRTLKGNQEKIEQVALENDRSRSAEPDNQCTMEAVDDDG